MAQIGKNIRAIRERRGMTQDDLAGRLYVSRQTISNYELGRSKPDIEILIRLAEILGTDLSVLIYGESDPTQRRDRIRRFWLAAVGCGVLLLCGCFLEKWIVTWQGEHYQSWPGSVECWVDLPGTYRRRQALLPKEKRSITQMRFDASGFFSGKREIGLVFLRKYSIIIILPLPSGSALRIQAGMGKSQRYQAAVYGQNQPVISLANAEKG